MEKLTTPKAQEDFLILANEIGGREGDQIWEDYTNFTVFPTHRELAKTMRLSPLPLRIEAAAQDIEWGNIFGGNQPCPALVWKVRQNPEGHHDGWIVYLTQNSMGEAIAGTLFAAKGPANIFGSFSMPLAKDPRRTIPCGGDVGSTQEIYAIRCTDKELASLIGDGDAPIETVIASTIASLFKWSLEDMPSEITVLDFQQANTLGVIDVDDSASLEEPAEKSELEVSLYVVTLGPGYAIAGNQVGQVLGRVKAGRANHQDSTNVAVSDVKDGQRAFKVAGHLQGALAELYGRTLRRAATGLEDDNRRGFLEQYGLTPSVSSLLEQMMMVYEYFHVTTLRWGLSVAGDVAKLVGPENPRFQEELKARAVADKLVQKDKYVGLARTQPMELRVKTLPLLCSIGLKYYQRSLTTAAQQQDFKGYAVDGVLASLDAAEDQVLVAQVADILPAPGLVQLARLIHYGTDTSGAKIASNMQADQVEAIALILAEYEKPCTWVVKFRKEKTVKARERLLVEWTKKFASIVEDKIEHYKKRANGLKDGDDKEAHLARVKELRASMEELSGGHEKMLAGLLSSHKMSRDDFSNELDQYARRIMEDINGRIAGVEAPATAYQPFGSVPDVKK